MIGRGFRIQICYKGLNPTDKNDIYLFDNYCL